MHTVKIINKNGKLIPTEVSIDGQPVRARSIDYHASLVSAPVVTLELPSLVDIEVNHAEIQFRFTPETITDAVKILRHELLNDTDLYAGFKASIKSALDEAKPYMDEENLAKAVLDRLIGEEDPL